MYLPAAPVLLNTGDILLYRTLLAVLLAATLASGALAGDDVNVELEAIYQTMIELPRSKYSKETDEEYSARIRIAAESLHLAAADPSNQDSWHLGRSRMITATLSAWYEESKFDPYVHIGPPTKHPVLTQDHGRARCFGQVQQTGLVPQDIWEKTTGVTVVNTKVCADMTIRVLRMYRYCYRAGRSDNPAASMFSGYGSGAGCAITSNGVRKAVLWRKLTDKFLEHKRRLRLARTKKDV